ncbi:probable calcium-binding protein CML22 [Abrus precatorius]|uniref:Probable calcium-binding protein CML22 n=1 Tax=Abrus precatorius TaxID=3816 RepID=A0A8B8JUH6_ABRPR|nr:probable calcium-binding protein CML22 [Abrus precatorius]
MGGMFSCFNKKKKPSKKKSLEEKLERKIAEIKRYKFGERRMKSIDNIFMMFPTFEEKLKSLRVMFEKYDVNSNGSIEPNELKRLLEHLQLHLPEDESQNIFKYCDIDGSKGIQFNEFIVLLCLVHLLTEPSSSDNPSKAELAQIGEIFDTIVEVFLFFDHNSDGKINHEDMALTLNETTPRERSPSHITRKRLEDIDWDKNGQATFRGFLFGFIKWIGIDVDE